MILSDTSVIVAAINTADANNRLCFETLKTVRTQIITTWPCVTEAMYLLGARIGWEGQEKLRQQIEIGYIKLLEPTQEDALRVCALMHKYADSPMDFADASLVVAAEVLNITRILTLDSHFYAYRINDKTHFEVIP